MKKRPYLGLLTTVRYLAAVLVVFFHYHNPAFTSSADNQLFKWMAEISRYGYAGVSFFFVLSGFILIYSYSFGNSLNATPREFWAARFARIYPLYAVALACSIPIFLSYVKDFSTLGIAKVAAKVGMEILLLQSWMPLGCGVNCPGWSLSVEAFFYALFPILSIFLIKQTTRNNILLFVLAWFLSMLGPVLHQILDLPDTEKNFLHLVVYNPLLHLPQFVMGSISGILFLRKIDKWAVRRWAHWLANITFILVILILLSIPILGIDLGYPFFNNGLLAPVFVALIVVLAFYQYHSTGQFNAKWLIMLGEASYAVYILQFPLAGWWSRIFHNSWIATFASPQELIIFTASLTALSVFAFHYFEKPIKRKLVTSFKSIRT